MVWMSCSSTSTRASEEALTVATVKPIVVAATFISVWSVAAQAQVERSGGAANAQLAQQYQQAVSERAQLQADNAKLKKNADDLKKQLDASKQQLDALKTGVSRSHVALEAAQATNEATDKTLADTKGKLQELIGRFRETATTLRDVETERVQLQQQLAQSKAAFDQCAERNYSLYQVNNEVLDRYVHQGAFSYLERAEPFTRIKRTQIDNLALEYRQRAEELRMKKAAAPAAGSAPPPAAPPSGSSDAGAPPPSKP